MIAFDDTGRVRWERSLLDRWSFNAGTYAPPWTPVDAATYTVGGETFVAWSASP